MSIITVSEKAAKEIQNIIKEQKMDENTFLRIGVVAGGCAGFQYVLDLTDAAGEHDHKFESNSVTIICDPKSLLYLEGTEIDFKTDLTGRGFSFKNPNSSSCCNCEKSFCT